MKEQNKVLEDIKKAKQLLGGNVISNKTNEYDFHYNYQDGVRYVSTEDLTKALITARQSEDIDSELGVILTMLNT